MMLAIFIITLAFTAVILFLRGGLYRVDAPPPAADADDAAAFSVVIAARNEERNIANCLQTVFAQNIPAGRFEVIVIDDRSEDSTPGILRELSNKYENLRVITVRETPPGVSPKKHAVTLGIRAARNGVIAFTDADCRVPPGWLRTIGKYMGADTALVQGVTSYSRAPGMNKLFYGLQAVDFISHGIVAAAAIGANLPINSNANNLAFRREAFENIGGYGADAHVVSADDDNLLQNIWKASRRRRAAGLPWKIRFMADAAGSVETNPTETAAGVFEQRKRWGSNTVHYCARQTALLSIVFAFYVTIAAAAAASTLNASYLPVCAALLLVKLAAELVLMLPGTRMFAQKPLRKYILPASLIQLPVVLAAVVFGVFGKFEWKGRRTRGTVS